jgi:acyl phosphate:glycerol-3-phosphate acyltransferase
MHFSLFLFFSFILGSIPFGKIVGLMNGVDIQKTGSGNIGFANSLRVLGWIPALFVLVGDILKGFIPVYFFQNQFTLTQIMIIGAAAIVGHIFSPWLKFRGGKGIATMIGVSLGFNFLIGSIAIIVWAIIFYSIKISSIASLTVTILIPLLALFFDPKVVILYILLVPLILFAHRKNISNLIAKKELKIK